MRHDPCLLVLHSTILIALLTRYTEYTECHVTICIAYHCFVIVVASWLNVTPSTQDGLTGSAWGDWANYTASPLRAFENELGVQAPVGFWDPAGLSSDGSVENFKRRRQTELKHGRISMLATMGYITPEITGNSLATCLLLLAWSLQTCPMVSPRSPKCQQQVGVRFWPTWPSAKFPRTSLLELLLQLVTLDGSSSHLLIRRSRKQSSMQSWQTEDWRWWQSLACSFRWWVNGDGWCLKGEEWKVMGDEWCIIGPNGHWKTLACLISQRSWSFSFVWFVSDLVRTWSMLVSASLYYIDGWLHWVILYELLLSYHFVIVWRVLNVATQWLDRKCLGWWARLTPLRAFENELYLWVSDPCFFRWQRWECDVETEPWSPCSQHVDSRNHGKVHLDFLFRLPGLKFADVSLSPKCQQQVGVNFGLHGLLLSAGTFRSSSHLHVAHEFGDDAIMFRWWVMVLDAEECDGWWLLKQAQIAIHELYTSVNLWHRLMLLICLAKLLYSFVSLHDPC